MHIRGPGNELGTINNKVQKEFNEVPSDGFHTLTHAQHDNSLTSIISLAIHEAASPRALIWLKKLWAGSFELRSPHFVDSVSEVQHLCVQLPDEGIQLLHGVEDLDALCVRVEADLEWSRHGGHPASASTKYNRYILNPYVALQQTI